MYSGLEAAHVRLGRHWRRWPAGRGYRMAADYRKRLP